ncbi:hypothetical protein N7505_007744 [Penicillium chrysogenum]|uniref:Uncharacterized protein n=1 Tax=Penicillium chrysogenum TaxID=5076 RepID=A0ABQ8WEA2_PENCH|nr:hypothetical protein N7505_007744 [Penicillium chrysogenum]
MCVKAVESGPAIAADQRRQWSVDDGDGDDSGTAGGDNAGAGAAVAGPVAPGDGAGNVVAPPAALDHGGDGIWLHLMLSAAATARV